MEQWYYAKDGQQHGPVGLEELRGLIANGTLNPSGDLVWNPGMKDWLPAAQIPVLMGAAITTRPSVSEPSQPFAYPTATGALTDIPPGSEPIIPTACVKRAFDLTVRHIGAMIGITLLYFVISVVLGEILGIADRALGWNPGRDLPANIPVTAGSMEAFKHGYLSESLSLPMTILSHISMVFFMLGFTKIGLNVVSGKPYGVGMLFGGGKWLLQGFIGYVLYSLMVGIGLVLLIVPGIYLMLRFGMYQNAIVDRNLGAIEAFKYSSEITVNNRASLFVIFLFAILILVAGCVAMFVGILFAYPVMWLSWIVAYRWMQYGGRAVLDDPVTRQPLLTGLED